MVSRSRNMQLYSLKCSYNQAKLDYIIPLCWLLDQYTKCVLCSNEHSEMFRVKIAKTKFTPDFPYIF
jgi:hypothetical protein